MKNPVGWFEIPVTDIERAIRFYEAVFGFSFQRMPLGELEMALFPSAEEGMGSSGALVAHKDFYHPSSDGTLLYFTTTSGDIANELARVEENGGKVLIPKRQISPEHGYMGVFLDSEGNRIAVHGR